LTIISFNHRWLLDIKNICPEIKTACLLYALPVNAVEIIKATCADGISLNVDLIDKELVDACHNCNFSVTAWNANDEKTFNTMKNLHIDFLATDNPRLCKQLLEQQTILVP
jgi:glycerophosphoryl diester phosphodiesterase